MFQVHSLQKRFVLFLFVPVILLLVAMGAAGFIYARQTIIAQWEEAAVLRLQRAAHLVDMRLSRPKELVRLYLESQRGHMGNAVRTAILGQLRETPGVLGIRRLTSAAGAVRKNQRPSAAGQDTRGSPMGRNPGSFRNRMPPNGSFSITLPRYDADVSNETISVVVQVVDDSGEAVESLEVMMEFKFLIADLPRSGWWETRKSFLVDETGRILVGSSDDHRAALGDAGDSLEIATLEALKDAPFGTIRGRGHPPGEVSGFYRLMEAPWFIVMFAPGSEILEPIIQFRNVYSLTLGVFMVIILFLIRRAVSRTTRTVRELSAAADQIAGGRFGEPLPVDSRDEIGELTRSFNTMSRQLKERIQMKRSLDLAKEVQQNLIPARDPVIDGIDIAGRSDFCDETGGDYYDYIQDCGAASCRIRIVVGDVAGHGVSSALLMSGVRASFRQRHAVAGSIEAVVTDVNRQVAMDVGNSGRFMTLFCLEVDVDQRFARWVRAGHEPALLYRASADRFESLTGDGIPLGVQEQYPFKGYSIGDLETGDIFVLGTDGVWETTDPSHEMFGKRRLKDLIRDNRHENAQFVLSRVFSAIEAYTEGKPHQDDVTLIIAKVTSRSTEMGNLSPAEGT